ncbi:unnamed protein product [Owenia fusiformis]|uniref:Uncharacterized protein n=1 Tax=Owenia fusiformis TaxID=6347 RepID=A0A8J1TTM6_OWEFU|nr:unnamed protein product [Owenia fusiformis]
MAVAYFRGNLIYIVCWAAFFITIMMYLTDEDIDTGIINSDSNATLNGQSEISRMFKQHIVCEKGINLTVITLNLTSQHEKGIPVSKVPDVSCPGILQNNKDAIQQAIDELNATVKVGVAPTVYKNLTNSCIEFHQTRRYIMKPTSKLEFDFPIAFDIIMYKDIEQMERLLRAIYRPWNYYCIHVDQKSGSELFEGVQGIASCLPNVETASTRIGVRWGAFSVLNANLICMRDLFKKKKWKYYINLTGQEFPMRTNLELVHILKAFNGSNNMKGTVEKAVSRRWGRQAGLEKLQLNMTMTKGEVHIVATRNFVDFVLHSNISKIFLEWVKGTAIPDETFFTALNHNPQLGVPGAYKGIPETNFHSYPFLARWKHWANRHWYPNGPCNGKWNKAICIMGIRDLHYMATDPHLFVNKLHLSFQHFALDCLEQHYFQRVLREYETKRPAINISYYEQFAFVKNHV